MKAKRFVTLGIIITGILFCLFNTVQAGQKLWPDSKGEICIENTDTGERARLAVTRTIGNHYLVHGRSEGSGGLTLVNGNAEVVGNTIFIHVTGSGYNAPQVHGFLGWLELNANTLVGTFVGIGNYCNFGDPTSCGQTPEGPQHLEPCP
jgi:hypothetical protein